MKKFAALILAIAMVVSCTIVSYAADDMPELIFDMDLSNCSDGTIDVTDASGSGKTGTITYGNAGTTETPGYGVNEYGTPYLILDTAGNTDAKNGTINVPVTDATVLDADGLSISAWIYDANSANRTSKYIFGLGTGEDTNPEWNSLLRKVTSGTWCAVRIEGNPNKDDSGASINIGTNPYHVGAWADGYKDSWKHLVITKQWTTTDASTGKGYYTIITYLDGAKLASYSNSKDADQKIRQKYSDTRNTAVLEIGGDGGNTANQAFPGYIADFKLYNGALTAEQVQREYIATGAGYLPTVAVSEHSLAAVGRETDTFTVEFDGAIDKETIKTGATVTDAEGTEVNTAFVSYDELSYIATFSILDYLEGGATYTLNLPDVRDTNGFALSQTKLTFTAKAESEATISAPTIAYKNSEGTVVDKALATTADLAATVTNTSGETMKYFLSLSVKDTAGGAYKMDVSAPLVIEAGTSGALTLNATGLIPGGSVVARIWCMTESGKLYPVETPAELQ